MWYTCPKLRGADVLKFSHPLARTARFWIEESLDNGTNDVFVITTTLELDPSHKKFKEDKIERLRGAAKEYLLESHPRVRKILLMNPHKI
jgi:hypothetical protein